jgi:hypothetical protein
MMNVPANLNLLRAQRFRELEHWRIATERLADLELLAPAPAWQALEHYVGISLRQALSATVARLRASVEQLHARLRSLPPENERSVNADLVSLHQAFLRAETTLDFYADALATRSTPRLAALLRACDHIATRAMAETLVPLGRQVPAALTYLDKGLGASILKAGIRLWDPATENPVAAIKAVRHNLLRPTALIHEAGHQVAHMLNWNEELAGALQSNISRRASPAVAEAWASWASEIAGDAYAFVHTGYAAVVALRDVVSGGQAAVFQLVPGDPHPVSWLRVRLGIEMCRSTFGSGPWDNLDAAWTFDYPRESAPAEVRMLLAESIDVLPVVVETVLQQPFRALAGQSLARIVDPARVSPLALARLNRDAGAAAFSSPYWLWNEAIRVLAMTGYKTGLGADDVREGLLEQERMMIRMGTLQHAA